MSRLQKQAAPLAKAEESASKAMSVVEKSMTELTVKLNETNRGANDIVKRNEREGNKLDEIKVLYCTVLLDYYKLNDDQRLEYRFITNCIDYSAALLLCRLSGVVRQCPVFAQPLITYFLIFSAKSRGGAEGGGETPEQNNADSKRHRRFAGETRRIGREGR